MAGTSGYGTQLTVAAAAIGEIISIDGPGIKVTKIDASHTLSADAYKEFIAGMLDGGDIKVELNWTPAAYSAMKTAAESRTLKACVITWPTSPAKTYSFNALVTEVGHKTSHDDKTTFPVTLSQSGKGTYA